MTWLVAALLVVPGSTSAQEKSPDEVYLKQVEKARIAYRVALAEQIRQAKVVDVFLLRFDDLRDDRASDDPESRFAIAPYKKTTSMISRKRLNSSQAKELLHALAKQFEKPEHFDQYMCHVPVHGVCIYSDEDSGIPFDSKLVYSGSFSWICRTFGFTYPDDGTEWLDTSRDLETVFNKLLPIPKEELERLEKKYPTKKKE